MPKAILHSAIQATCTYLEVHYVRDDLAMLDW